MALPDTMRAAAIDRFGGPEEIKLRALPLPRIEADEILIRVDTAGVGAWDPFEREGQMVEMMKGEPRFPYVQGSDGAGKVAAVGDDVSEFKEGDAVYGHAFLSPKGGFNAEYVAVKANVAAPVPEGLDMAQAGAMPVGALTALQGLDDTLGIQAGEKLLIFGASGDVGHLAVQLAKRMGADVLAVASGDDGVALAKRLGADAVVDGKSGDVEAAIRNFAPDGLDAALVVATGDGLDDALAAVRDGGRVAHPNGVEPAPKARTAVTVKSYDMMPDREVLQKLNRLIEAGPFEVHVAKSFPFEEAEAAHRALDEHHIGKLILRAGDKGETG